MLDLVERIQQLTEEELREVMTAVQNRYARAYPQWEVLYIAIHRDPELRRKDVDDILAFMRKAGQWELPD